MAIVIGWLYAAGLYMMLRRSVIKLIFGLAFLSHGSNLMVFMSGRLVRAHPPILPADASQPGVAVADPLPQALVLTAIVISFGVLAFALALIHRVSATVGMDDHDEMRVSDR